jgi:hypothetical protein
MDGSIGATWDFFFCSFSHFFSCDLAQLTGGEKKKNATDFEQAPM